LPPQSHHTSKRQSATRSDTLRVGARIAATVVWLLMCLLLYTLALPFRRANPVPRVFLAGLLPIAGVRLVVIGEPVQARTFLIANHASWLDIPALAGAAGSAFVAHDGLAGHPVMRFLCRLNRTVFVARHDRASVAAQIRQVRAALADDGVLTVFPEGTTGDGRTLLPFKSSLLAAIAGSDTEVTVRPARIDYGADSGEIAWFGDEPGLANVLRIFARRHPFAVCVHLLPPLSAEERADRKSIAAAARAAIEAAAGTESDDQRVAL